MLLAVALLAVTPNQIFAPHFEERTEWWYYTGNLATTSGHRFGFELTFFRSHIDAHEPGVWDPSQIYLAHFAISDLSGKQFYYKERVNRAGPGIAGVDARHCWNGNWQALWPADVMGIQQLQAVAERAGLALTLQPEKQPVPEGPGGISTKGPGETSHYFSFTRLRTHGEISWNSQTFQVEGDAWMDHEYFTSPQHSQISGWDWFSIQLDSGEDIMLYRLHNRDGSTGYSSGAYVDKNGATIFLAAADFHLQEQNNGDWLIQIPPLHLNLREHTDLQSQELKGNGTTPSYWEGAVTYTGDKTGHGYLERTGYNGQQVWLGSQK